LHTFTENEVESFKARPRWLGGNFKKRRGGEGLIDYGLPSGFKGLAVVGNHRVHVPSVEVGNYLAAERLNWVGVQSQAVLDTPIVVQQGQGAARGSASGGPSGGLSALNSSRDSPRASPRNSPRADRRAVIGLASAAVGGASSGAGVIGGGMAGKRGGSKYGARFSTGFCTRGFYWIPRLLCDAISAAT
jgi:hypothetical protein